MNSNFINPFLYTLEIDRNCSILVHFLFYWFFGNELKNDWGNESMSNLCLTRKIIFCYIFYTIETLFLLIKNRKKQIFYLQMLEIKMLQIKLHKLIEKYEARNSFQMNDNLICTTFIHYKRMLCLFLNAFALWNVIYISWFFFCILGEVHPTWKLSVTRE